jgi:predicted aldo/keto reductase-like oxidoreductase
MPNVYEEGFTPKKLGFGFMRLPLLDKSDQTSIDLKQVIRMVDEFMRGGFTYFDTAQRYHDGESQTALRKALVERYPRDAYTVASKMLPYLAETADDLPRLFNEQLEQLGLDYLDYYLVHNINQGSYDKANAIGAFDFISKLKADGKVREIGFSHHGTPELLDEILTTHPELDFVQLQINYLDYEYPGIESRRQIEIANAHGIPIVAMEPLKGGNLAQIDSLASNFMMAAHPGWGATDWGLHFAASMPGVRTVLSGMSTYLQVVENVESMEDETPLTPEQIEATQKAVKIILLDNTINCTTCHYCEEGCPENIAIPDYFSLYNSAKRDQSGNIWSQYTFYQDIASRRGKASDCEECGKCEETCPQHIHIIDELKNVADLLEHEPVLTEPTFS